MNNAVEVMSHETDTAVVVKHMLGVPLRAWAVIAGIISFVVVTWLSHDRAIASTARDVAEISARAKTLEDHEKERAKDDKNAAEKKASADRALAETLGRMEGKIDGLKDTVDDVKDRVKRIEDRGKR
jgi:hypothetical protein